MEHGRPVRPLEFPVAGAGHEKDRARHAPCVDPVRNDGVSGGEACVLRDLTGGTGPC